VSGVFIAVGKIMESLHILDVRICRISPSGFMELHCYYSFIISFLFSILFVLFDWHIIHISTFPSQNELSVVPVNAADTEIFPYFTAQDAAHSLTILRSKKAPVIKKRQVMRSSFGDYRTKMAEEEKKLNKGWLFHAV